MTRNQRIRFVTYAVWILLAVTLAWTAATHGWEAALRSAVGLAVCLVVVLAIIAWTERGKR